MVYIMVYGEGVYGLYNGFRFIQWFMVNLVVYVWFNASWLMVHGLYNGLWLI